MTKTIEAAANEYAANWAAKHRIYNPELYDLIVDAYKASGERIMSLPLASRLTAEEKERVKANYADAKDIHLRCVGTMSKNHIADLHNEHNKGLNMGIMIVLKHLFGADFFKKGE